MNISITALTLAAATAVATVAPAQTSATDVAPLFGEPRLITNAMARIEKFGADDLGQPSDGFYPELGQMITGAGWISVGPGYRRHILRGHALVDASAALSWRMYKIAQAHVDFPQLANGRVSAGAKLLWQDFTQVRYFGAGRATLETGVSDYRLQTTDVVGYATWRVTSTVAVTGIAGSLTAPRVSASAGSFDRGEPDTTSVYPTDPGVGLADQPRFVHGEVSITADTRNNASVPTRGAVVHAAWSTYRDQAAGTLSFQRVDTEAACFVPIGGAGVLAARFWGVFTDPFDGAAVPFYMMPSLGGHNTLRGYADYRFHDRHVVVANLESRWAIFEHVDAAVFLDAGNVAARARDLDIERRSYGLGVRLHTSKAAVARFDAARSREGWRFMLKLSDPLRLGRLTKRTAAVPFVP